MSEPPEGQKERRKSCTKFCGPAVELAGLKAEVHSLREDFESFREDAKPMLSVYRDATGATRVIKWIAGGIVTLGIIYGAVKLGGP